MLGVSAIFLCTSGHPSCSRRRGLFPRRGLCRCRVGVVGESAVASWRAPFCSALWTFSFSLFCTFSVSHSLILLLLTLHAALRQRFEPPSTCYTSTSRTSSASRSWHLDPAPWRFAGNSRESPGDTAPARSSIKIGYFNQKFKRFSCAPSRAEQSRWRGYAECSVPPRCGEQQGRLRDPVIGRIVTPSPFRISVVPTLTYMISCYLQIPPW